MTLKIDKRQDGWWLEGELSIETVPDAEKQSQAFLSLGQRPANMIISFAHISKVDTAGLAWLLNFSSALRKSGTDVKVEHPPEALLKLSRLSNAEALVFGESTQD